MSKKHKGLFYFADTEGLPLDISINYLKKNCGLTEKGFQWRIIEFVCDALEAGWKVSKIKSDLREADRCGGLGLEEWMPKLYKD